MVNVDINEITNLLFHQINQFWRNYNKKIILNCIPKALNQMELDFCEMSSKRLYENGRMNFSPTHSVTWMVFLYRISHILSKQGNIIEADIIYYLNKVMHSVDWFHRVELPLHFFAEHPLGSVLGKARYGDYLFVYQGTTVGGNRKDGELYYPILGNNILMYANTTILGECYIGNNVIISADSYLINEIVPDESIVFGRSPNIVIKKKTEKEIKCLTSHLWNWQL